MPPAQFFDLLNALSSLDVDKFQSFEILTTQYKYLGQRSSGIATDILIPKRLVEPKSYAKCPILVRIHGGFLVRHFLGSMAVDWTWFLNRIIRSPDRADMLLGSRPGSWISPLKTRP
jgi:hypothetical protein